MDKLRITGGSRLHGRVEISGAKNAALPALAASLLTAEELVIENVPRVRDVATFNRLLSSLGAEVFQNRPACRVSARKLSSLEAPYDLVKTMRASVLVLGPLVARFGRARVSLPGGCAIGARPINLHLAGLEKMGAEIEVVHGYVEARAASGGRLRGAEIQFDISTVTGTENLMMAAALARGETILLNAACEPEVVDLAELLIKMGAKIEGAGTKTIRIKGVEELHGARHRIIPDRIEAGTFMVAAAITRGHLLLDKCCPDHLGAVIEKLRETGAEINQIDGNALEVRGGEVIRSVDVTTNPYPAFPTDMQAQYMALMTQGDGVSVITETIFENRFIHALELMRMGADIKVEGRRAIVRGGRPLTGADLIASDLRASASLVLAGLVAEGYTIIDRVYHLDRGYEALEEKLRAVGAKIERIK